MPASAMPGGTDAAPVEAQTCGCGCGLPQTAGRESSARQLGAALAAVRLLQVRAAGLGRPAEHAAHLLWAWHRCAPGFESYVHGSGGVPPTAAWLDVWRRRIALLKPDG